MRKLWIMILVALTVMGCHNASESSTVKEDLSRAQDAAYEQEGFVNISKNAETAYTYQWGSSEVATEGITLASTGTYTVTVTDENGNNTRSALPIKDASTIKTADKIIKTGNIGMQVEDYEKAMQLIDERVKAAQGYISSQSENRTDYRISNSISIRVPNSQFDVLVDGIGGIAQKLTYKNIYAQDVTEEYMDVATRLKAKKEVEARYLDILKSAKTIKDVLAVEEQLRVIREEIESATGRLKYMDDRVAYSTITLELYQEIDYNAPAPLQAGFGTKIVDAFTDGWNSMLGLVIGMARSWPALIIFSLIIAFIYRKWKNRAKFVA